jgi:mannose-6-phosphate isomerase-like protein (cupin superfamily)
MNTLGKVFAVLKPDLSVDTVPVTPTIYPDLDANYQQFKGHVLVSEHAFSESWPSWERHPAGDEIVVLLSGSATMVLETGNAENTVQLQEPGAYVVVPRGCWHTARIVEPTRMLFITPGEGTENRLRT